jgi:hypothetical protein
MLHQEHARAALVILLATLSTRPVSAAERPHSVYTQTRAVQCETLWRDVNLLVWRCVGPGTYSALFSDDGEWADVRFGFKGQEEGSGDLRWRVGNESIGAKIEWRVRRSSAYAAIVRVNIRDDNGRTSGQLLIAKVGPQGSCRIALIDASQIGAKARARRIADARGPNHVCAR